MKQWIRIPLLLALAWLAANETAVAQKKKKSKACVALARSWDSAVEKARLLNVPIVVHHHGFYCGPCWGMHSAVLENKKYIKFSRVKTVEVAVIGQLEKGIAEGNSKAGIYRAKGSDGQEVAYMLHWPGITAKELIALGRSKAASYNKTGKVPYTCIVDPHTLKELKSWLGGTSGKSIMNEIKAVRKNLVKHHGPGVSRAALSGLRSAEDRIPTLMRSGDFSEAMDLLEKAAGKSDPPKAIKKRINAARKQIIDAASAQLEAIRAKAADDPAIARKELSRLVKKLRGTGLENKAKAMLKEISSN